MIDFIQAYKCYGKDTINLQHCTHNSSYASGVEEYYIEGCKQMRLRINPKSRIFTISGSIPYFLQGHNFLFNTEGYITAIDYLQNILGIGLWDAGVKDFEYGVIFQIEDHKPSDYIRNHHINNYLAKSERLVENSKPSDKGKFKWWEGKNEILKLYDAGANLQCKQGLSVKKAIEASGFNPKGKYLKFEVKYTNPHKLTFGVKKVGTDMILEDLQNPVCLNYLNELTLNQYKLLSPMKSLIMPTNKKELYPVDLITLTFVERMMNTEGMSAEDVRKMVNNTINSVPNECLGKNDKDYRKGEVRKIFRRLKEAESSQWDLTEKIEKALASEG